METNTDRIYAVLQAIESTDWNEAIAILSNMSEYNSSDSAALEIVREARKRVARLNGAA